MTRRTRWIRRILFALLALGALYGLAFLVGSIHASARLEAALEEARNADASLTPSAAAPSPIPDAENAAVLLQEAFSRLVEEPDELFGHWEELQDDAAALSPEAASLFSAWVAQNEPALTLVEAALERPRCLFLRDWSKGWEAAADHVPGLQAVSRLLLVRGYLQIRDGDGGGALSTARTLIRLGRVARGHPALLDLLVGMGIEDVGRNIGRLALSVGPPSAAALRSLLEALAYAPDAAPLEAALVFERALGNFLFERWPDDEHDEMLVDIMGSQRTLVSRVGTALFDAPAHRLDHARYLELMARVIDVARRPFVEAKAEWSKLSAECADAPWYDRLTRNALTVHETAMRAWEVHRTRGDLARIAAEVELFALREGALPESLTALELPGGVRDRLGTGPYRYRLLGDGGYVLHSVGMDGLDDAGRESDDPRTRGDLVWRRPSRVP